MQIRSLLVVTLVIACGPAPESRTPVEEGPPRGLEPTSDHVERVAREFDTLEEEFLEWYYQAQPVRATQLGIHEYDAQLPSYDRASIQRRIDDLLDLLARAERTPVTVLAPERRWDYATLEFGLRAELLDLEETRRWVNDPRLYTGVVASGLSSLAQRQFAPVEERVRSLVARMGAAPGLLRAARENLRNPPRVWTELAIQETEGLRAYLEDDLPAALAAQAGGPVDDPRLSSAVEALTTALGEHRDWLESDLLPRSDGDFRLGRFLFERKLLYEEHTALNAQQLNELNQQKILEYRDWVARVAAEIDPDRTPAAIMDSITRIHPTPEELIPTAREMMMDARAWVLENDVVTVPTDDVPVVRETPPYDRGGFASMDAPGPFSEGSLDAYYNITNVDPAWTEEQKRQHLTYFNYPGLLGVTVHETFPGHFVQLAYMRQVENPLRRVFAPRTLVEGWAHYTEQMVLDETFGDGDPVLRLGQLRRALQRHARWHAGLQMHAFGATIEDVVPQFMEIAYFDEFPARREVIRGTYDPTYLYYALGRMQIFELRDDYQEHMEEEERAFSLREFHDEFLALGLPVTLARAALLEPRQAPYLENFRVRGRR